ncbi:ATP-grasp domain-containing protein [Paenibacillus piscarius]|uniref:ATP-grasp domain-containing protein n=1 Tax=Paenibacillus piscarius TaxID=1089681 RepID=UPI001EE87916|nr:ATP-grasp domain-containing protein [Paenibacillus piscarius]
MAILILNQRRRAFAPYLSWLEDLDEEIFLYTSPGYGETTEPYAIIRVFEHWVTNDRVEIEALRLHQEHPYRLIIALDESDLIRAARLRERLGLPGQRLESAVAYRDKVVMKSLVSTQLSCPAFRRLASPLDLIDFVQEQGLPVVIKPYDGMGSMNTEIIRNPRQLNEVWERGLGSGLMAEAYVEGEMYEIDGLMMGQEIRFASVGKYSCPPLEILHKECFVELLSPGSAVYQQLVQIVQQVIEILPSPGVSTFHCEMFHTPEDEWIFCEIASRTAGGRISESISAMYDVNLNREWVRGVCGLPLKLPAGSPPGVAGVYLMPRRPGTVKALPQSLPFEWVTEYVPRVREGERLDAAHSSVDAVMTVIIVGEDSASLQSRLSGLLRYLEREVHILPAYKEDTDEAPVVS